MDSPADAIAFSPVQPTQEQTFSATSATSVVCDDNNNSNAEDKSSISPSRSGGSSPLLSPRIILDPGSDYFPPKGSSAEHPSGVSPSLIHHATNQIDEQEGPTITSTGEILPAPIIIPPYWSHKRQISTNSAISFPPSNNGAFLGTSHNGKTRGNGQIRMEDNTTPEAEALSQNSGIRSPLWAKLVSIDSYTIVSGNVKSGLFGSSMSNSTSSPFFRNGNGNGNGSSSTSNIGSSSGGGGGGGGGTGIGSLVTSGVGVGDYVVWSCSVRMLDGGDVRLHKRYSEFEALRRELVGCFPRAGSSLPVLPPKSVFYRFRPAFLEKRRAGLEYFLNCVLLNPEFASSAVLKEFVFS